MLSASNVFTQQAVQGVACLKRNRVMRALIPVLLTFATSLTPGVTKLGEVQENWMIGAWEMTYDEDGTPADIMEFRADGTHVFWGIPSACVPHLTNYHVHLGDIYVTIEVPGQGPIAAIFRPNEGRTKLVFTSPRTRNSATYQRLQENPCSAD
jgi:hypothetical protein